MKDRTPSRPASSIPAALACVVALAIPGCGDETPSRTAPKAPTVQPAPQAESRPAVPAPGDSASGSTQEAANSALAARVKAALVAEPLLKAHAIDVLARDGAVTLFGTTESKMKREMAENVAKAVPGVKSVENRLAVVAGS